MTTVYFIRHAEPSSAIKDGYLCPLTEKGIADSLLVTKYLNDKHIDVIFSSPHKCAIDTLAHFAEANERQIGIIENFKEAQIWKHRLSAEVFNHRVSQQFSDFSHTYGDDDGESMRSLQDRNIATLFNILDRHKGKNIVIGTHGQALSAIINYFDSSYGFEDCCAMADIMPWVVKIEFEGRKCFSMTKLDLFQPDKTTDYQKLKVRLAELNKLQPYKYVVTFARYQDKWLYCRAKTRDSFETAGGSIEQGETPLDAAKRELYEETGAVKFEIRPLFDYSVNTFTSYSAGQVFLADVTELADIPDFEMAEVSLFDKIPDKMRFPMILPVLFEEVQKHI